jgi:hypothetical protein
MEIGLRELGCIVTSKEVAGTTLAELEDTWRKSAWKWAPQKVMGMAAGSLISIRSWVTSLQEISFQAGGVAQVVEYLPTKCIGPEFKPQYPIGKKENKLGFQSGLS